MYAFTVCTPTYNRINTLPRVYESLKSQTCHDFEWLIADDGSTDGTAPLVESWQKEAAFPIRYFWQENRGKLAAVNRGVETALGRLFVILDSDDACVPQALERFKFHWDSIPEAARERFSSVTALCLGEHGSAVGGKFPADVTDSDSLEMRYKFRVKGEKWGCHRTEVLKRFPFPVVEGETYVPESVLWSALARQYKTRFVNEPLRIYFRSEDGSSERHLAGWSSAMKHSQGLVIWHESILNRDIDWLAYAPVEFLRSALHYSRFAFRSGRGIAAQARALKNPRARMLWVLAVPFGASMFLRDSQRVRQK